MEGYIALWTHTLTLTHTHTHTHGAKLCTKTNLSSHLFIEYLVSNIIIIIFINCNWAVTRWQWLFYMYTKYEIGY